MNILKSQLKEHKIRDVEQYTSSGDHVSNCDK
jgi:hypothetical protein